jgi:hypothetical protein
VVLHPTLARPREETVFRLEPKCAGAHDRHEATPAAHSSAGRGTRRAHSLRNAARGATVAILACSPTPPEARPDLVFHTGDAFSVELVTRTAGYPTLLHVGPRGDVAIVYPGDATTPRERLPAGARVRLPANADSAQWVFEGDPGWETFVLVVGEAPPSALEDVLSKAEDPADAGRARFVHDLERALRPLGDIETLEVLHLP